MSEQILQRRRSELLDLIWNSEEQNWTRTIEVCTKEQKNWQKKSRMEQTLNETTKVETVSTVARVVLKRCERDQLKDRDKSDRISIERKATK